MSHFYCLDRPENVQSRGIIISFALIHSPGLYPMNRLKKNWTVAYASTRTFGFVGFIFPPWRAVNLWPHERYASVYRINAWHEIGVPLIYPELDCALFSNRREFMSLVSYRQLLFAFAYFCHSQSMPFNCLNSVLINNGRICE